MNMSDTAAPPSTANIAAALAAAQKAFAPIPKDREVVVRTKTGGSYKFKYATLDAIRTATMPALAEQKIAVVQGMVETGRGYAIETRLLHASGEELRNVTPMFVSGQGNQELGSAQSYARRYGLSALLCVTADEDDDGNTADGHHIEEATERQPQPRPIPRNDANSMWGNGHANVDPADRDLVSKGPTAGQLTRIKKWLEGAHGTLKLTGQTPETLGEFRKANAAKFQWVEDNMPEESVALEKAYQAALDAAQARMPASTLMAGD